MEQKTNNLRTSLMRFKYLSRKNFILTLCDLTAKWIYSSKMRMPSKKQYNLVINDELDSRVPLHPDEAFATGIKFSAKVSTICYSWLLCNLINIWDFKLNKKDQISWIIKKITAVLLYFGKALNCFLGQDCLGELDTTNIKCCPLYE